MAEGYPPLLHASLPECQEITDDRAIRQGDVFEWLEASTDPYRFLALVVTADCDIAHAKHAGVLSYVPILTLADYLRLFYLPKILERGITPLADQLTKAVLAQQVVDEIRQYQLANLPEFPTPISEQAAIRWLSSGDPNDIANQLGIVDQKAREKFLALVNDYTFVDAALQSKLFIDQVAAILRLRIRNGQTLENARKIVCREIHSAVRDLPGDAFFIGNITPRLSSGYVTYLRLVREIGDNQLAVRQSDLHVASKPVAKRIARLRSPYIFGLTQQLAAVFGAVGLSKEYEDQRERIVEQLAINHVIQGIR